MFQCHGSRHDRTEDKDSAPTEPLILRFFVVRVAADRAASAWMVRVRVLEVDVTASSLECREHIVADQTGIAPTGSSFLYAFHGQPPTTRLLRDYMHELA